MKIKKKAALMAVAALALFAMLTTFVGARGPTNVCGAPYNPIAWWHSGQYIGPEMFGIGTPTWVYQDDVTILVGQIPMAVQDPQTGEWSGTHLMWKVNYGHVPEDYRSSYKFWLNGSGPVKITYYYAGGSTVVDYATEFIFFKTYFEGSVWKFTLQTYR